MVRPLASRESPWRIPENPTAEGSRWAQVDEHGRFAVTGIRPGTEYEIVVVFGPRTAEGWHVENIAWRETDLRDAPLTFEQGSIEGVDLWLGTEKSEISGRIATRSGEPAVEYTVVVGPADTALWHPASQRIRMVRPATDGAYVVAGLPPGVYRLVAIVDPTEEELQDPDFLHVNAEGMIEVVVSRGEATRQDIFVK